MATMDTPIDRIVVNTLMRGPLEVAARQIVRMVDPLLGFEKLPRWHFFQTQPGPLGWMQSLDDAKVCFCVLQPLTIGLDYDIAIGPQDLSDLDSDDLSAVSVYTIVTLAQAAQETTVNLRAPILVVHDTGLGKQVVLDDARLPVRFPLSKLQRRAAG
jgi:flagellar assembly factor FliW